MFGLSLEHSYNTVEEKFTVCGHPVHSADCPSMSKFLSVCLYSCFFKKSAISQC